MSAATVFARARSDPELVRLEGFHALKHALRFGADVLAAVAEQRPTLDTLVDELAPDLHATLQARIEVAPLAGLVARPHPTGVAAVARRPPFDVAALLAAPPGAPIVVLEDPRRLGNVGAAIRVAAAAGAAGVLTTGPADPWDPAAVRGAAGLQFALPVGRVEPAALTGRPLVAIDPGGSPLGATPLPGGALLAFGTERRGLSSELLERAQTRLRIPMRDGVSSLNLATAVAVALYASGSSSASASP